MPTPEYEQVAPQPEQNLGIQEIPSQPEIPEHIQQIGVQSVPQHPANLQDNLGNVVIQSTNMTAPTVQIPADPKILHNWATGSPAESKTWLGIFWERVFKRAVLFGKKVIVGNPTNA